MPFKSEKQRRWMHANKPKLAKKWEKKKEAVEEKKERDYKAEYKKFQSSTKAKKYRAELNKYNRQKGTYGNGDGKDASHKGGKIVGFEAQSKNRGRREKSRLKKESTVLEDITNLEKLAMKLLRNINKNAGVKNYDHEKTADFNKVVKFLKGKMPKVPNQRIGQIAMSYHDYRKKQPKIKIPDIDSVKDMEKTLKKLGMKEGVNERDNVGMAYKRTLAKVELKKIKDAIEMFQKRIKKQGSVTNARDEEHLKNLIKVYKGMGGKGIRESINEQQYFDPKGKLKKYMDKVLKQAGIRVIKYDPMKQSFYNGTWGGFYTVASSNKVDMPGQGKVKRSSAVLPVYIDKKGEVELGVSGDGFKLGKVGSSQVLKNLKDFKKGDLEESINEMKVYSKSQGMKKIKSMKKTGGAKIYKVDKVKTKIGGKNVNMYNLYTRNQNHTSNQNPYGLDMMKGAYLIPIEEGTCGYGLDGNLGEEPAGPHLMKKIKKITKDKEKLKEDIEMSKGVKKLMKIADEGFGKVGGTTVDSMSAGLFKQIYNKVNDDLKKKLNQKNEKQLVRIIGGMWKKFGKNVSIGSSL